MKTVRLIKGSAYAHQGVTYESGHTYEVDDEVAQKLSEFGSFYIVEEPQSHPCSEFDGSEFAISQGPLPKSSLNKFTSFDELQNKAILLKRHGAIGDIVFVATIADHIKRSAPTCKICLAVQPEQMKFAASFDAVDHVVSLDMAARANVISRFDYILHFNEVIEGRAKDDRDYFEAHFERCGLDVDAVPTTFAAVGVRRLASDPVTAQSALEVLKREGVGAEPYVAVVVGSSNPLKTIHPEALNKLLEELAGAADKKRRLRVVCIGGNNDRIPTIKNAYVHIATGQSLHVSAELIRRSQVVVGGDTGLVQFAAAIGVPTVAFFGPTDPKLSIKHYQGCVDTIPSGMACAPCQHLRTAYCMYFESGYPDCMRGVDVDAVAKAVRSAYTEEPHIAASTVVQDNGEVTKSPGVARLRIAVLLDNSAYFTGGGFYMWQLAKALADQHSSFVDVVVDSPDNVYSATKGNRSNLRVVQGLKDGVWTHDANITYNLVIAQPPNLGHMANNYARSYGARSILVVYETPSYIAQYRKGEDAKEPYWAEYKEALKECDAVWIISKIVRQHCIDWIPEIRKKSDVVSPSIDNETADSVDVAEKTDSIVMISRNVKYKKLSEAASVLINAFSARGSGFSAKRQLHIHVIGDKASSLGRVVQGTKAVKLHLHNNLDEITKWQLLKKAKAVVHPSTFEGFGIPLAEAMYAKTPVLAHPLKVFKECFTEDCFFSYTDSASLVEKVTEIFEAYDNKKSTLEKILKTARTRVGMRFTLKMRKARLAAILAVRFADDLIKSEKAILREQKEASASRRIAIVSSWGNRCGIAETTELWSSHLDCTYKVFAPHERAEDLVKPDDGRVVRCWNRSFNERGELFAALLEFAPDIVHFQHEFSFFTHTDESQATFFQLIRELRERGMKVVVTVHTYLRSRFLDELPERVDHVITTKAHEDCIYGERFSVVELPVEQVDRVGFDVARRQIGWADRPRYIVGAFGIWNPHKGFDAFLATYGEVSARCGSETRYVVCGYRDPRNPYAQETIRKYQKLMDTGHLHMFTSYDDIQQVANRLSVCDVLVFPYNGIGHSSASAAIRTGMSVGRPIICTYSPMFSEFAHEEHVLKVQAGDHQQLVSAILRLHNDKDMALALTQNCNKYVASCAPAETARRHEKVYTLVCGAESRV